MKIIVILLIQFILRTQNADAKEIPSLKSYLGHLSQNQLNGIYEIHSKELTNLDVNKLLSINDLWNKIKNNVANAWNAIKNLATKIKGKIIGWIQEIKKLAEELAKDFQAKLEALKAKLNKFIQAGKNIVTDVKQCIKEDEDAINKLLKQIAKSVTNCTAESVKNATSVLGSCESRLALDDNEIVKGAEEKMNKCVQDVDNADKCLNKARGEIYDDMEHTENGIMETRSVSRGLVESALETIMKCAADGIIEASGAITDEVIKIMNCVTSDKQKLDI